MNIRLDYLPMDQIYVNHKGNLQSDIGNHGEKMEAVTLSSKFQVVIPSRVRKRLGMQPGQKIRVLLYDNRIELIPIKPMREARGFLQGIDTTVSREEDRV